MSKKQQLKIVGTEIRRSTPVLEANAKAPGTVSERLHVSFEVENPSDKPLHVWATRRAYDYDASTHQLTLYLTDHTPDLPPGIEMISDHPRTPAQVVVDPGSRATVDVLVPSVIRRRVPGQGLGMQFVEEPIGHIERVNLHVQYASEPIQHRVGDSPAEHRKRLMAHGQVVRATITPTRQKEQ
jgi:hypothetical protein